MKSYPEYNDGIKIQDYFKFILKFIKRYYRILFVMLCIMVGGKHVLLGKLDRLFSSPPPEIISIESLHKTIHSDVTLYYYGRELYTGLGKSYFKNGQLQSEIYFENGQMEGGYKLYYENKNLECMGRFKTGLKDGYWKYFYESGLLKKEENYHFGVLTDWTRSYNKDGKLISEKCWNEHGELLDCE